MACHCHRMDCVRCNRWRVMSCWRKQIHTTPEDAIRAAGSARARAHDDSIQAYRCVFGAHWHIGHAQRPEGYDPTKLPRRRMSA